MTAQSYERAEMELELPAAATSVSRAREAVGELARAVGASEADVKLAVSEAVGNAVIHAFRDASPGTVRVRAARAGDRLNVSVADDGSGMSPNLDSPGLGLGLSLITRLALDVHFDSSGEGTTVSMSFPAGEGAAAG